MMDWPVAAVMLGSLTTLIVGILKIGGKGKVKAEDLVDWREYKDFRGEVRTRLVALEHGQSKLQQTASCILAKLNGPSGS